MELLLIYPTNPVARVPTFSILAALGPTLIFNSSSYSVNFSCCSCQYVAKHFLWSQQYTKLIVLNTPKIHTLMSENTKI